MREKNVTALLRWVLEILYREMGLLRGTVTLRRGDQLFIEASHGLSDAEIRRGKYRLGIDRYGKAVPADIIRNRLHKIAFQNGLALIPRRRNGDG